MISLLAFFCALFFANCESHKKKERIIRDRGLKIMKDLNLTDQKKTITSLTGKFLEQTFGISSGSISVLMDHGTILIRADNFLSPAEKKVGTGRKDKELIRRMYSKIFDDAQEPLADQIGQIIGRKLVSSQVSIDFEVKVLLLTFFFS